MRRPQAHILLAKPEELRDLGLDLDKPITLKDIVKAVEEKLARVRAAGSPST